MFLGDCETHKRSPVPGLGQRFSVCNPLCRLWDGGRCWRGRRGGVTRLGEEIGREVRRAGGQGRVCLGKTNRSPEANRRHRTVGFCGGGGAEGFGAQIWLGLEGVWPTRERGLGASEMFTASFPRPTHHHPLSQFKITVGLWLLAAWAVVSSTISLMSGPDPGMEEERSCRVDGKSER